MNAIRILAETSDSVTISREDWVDLLAGLEDSEDRAAVTERRAYEARVGKDVARRDYLTSGEALRLLDGEHPIRLWREKRALSQRQLAAAANISPSYLAEIEAGRKPGSQDAILKIAHILGVPKEDLMHDLQRMRAPDFGPVSARWWPHDIGIGPGGRGAPPEVRKFATVSEAVEFVRADWRRMSGYGVFIEAEDGKVIYDPSDLYREIDPDTYAISHRQAVR
jgi:transcriptional regulator with XRE-family HTH domain